MNDARADKPITKIRLNTLLFGDILLIFFLLSTTCLGIWFIRELATNGFKDTFKNLWPLLLTFFLVELIIFWAGIIIVYVTSAQLGIKTRVIGIICGMIPIAHIIVLIMIIRITFREVTFEKGKMKLDASRASEQICKTKYPILMVHGVFFRDLKYLNYWGRVPAELEKNGATIYYGNHQSALSVDNSAKELAARIKEIVEETGCGKVNVIAHSKGGLDTKWAIATLGIAPYVASVTTVNTPHRGCEFAEYLLNKAPVSLRNKVAAAYEAAFRKLGDTTPSFVDAVTDLTAQRAREISEYADQFDYKAAGIYTQSIGSWMKKASSGPFPLNMSYPLVKHFDGKNDGLVAEPSFRWGEDYTFIENKKKRGISHADMIDLMRENINGFDVREFFVQIVAGLKNRGL